MLRDCDAGYPKGTSSGRRAVLATAAATRLNIATRVSLRRNGVVKILMYFCVHSGSCAPASHA